jgi:hypothetical protein
VETRPREVDGRWMGNAGGEVSIPCFLGSALRAYIELGERGGVVLHSLMSWVAEARGSRTCTEERRSLEQGTSGAPLARLFFFSSLPHLSIRR